MFAIFSGTQEEGSGVHGSTIFFSLEFFMRGGAGVWAWGQGKGRPFFREPPNILLFSRVLLHTNLKLLARNSK